MIALFFDTETTGFKHDDFIPQIVQIAAIMQDTETRRELAVVSLMVVPNHPIPAEVAKIHGITTELVRSAGVLQNHAHSMFGELVRLSDVIVAHNIGFDLQMVKDNWPAAYALLEGKQKYDTMEEATPVMKLPKTKDSSYHNDKYPDFKAPRLQEAHEHLCGSTFTNAHNALADAGACRDVFFALQDKLELTDA